MQEPDTEFLIRRIGQLWAEAAGLPERSPAQKQVENLAGGLSDYVANLYQERSGTRAHPPAGKRIGDGHSRMIGWGRKLCVRLPVSSLA